MKTCKPLSPFHSWWQAYLASLQLLRNDIGAYLRGVDYIASVLGVSAHGSGAGAFIVAAFVGCLLCGQAESRELPREGGCSAHDERRVVRCVLSNSIESGTSGSRFGGFAEKN